MPRVKVLTVKPVRTVGTTTLGVATTNVGTGVGARVGGVGAGVGATVGCLVGARVGAFVGCLVGAAVGAAVGAIVGDDVGPMGTGVGGVGARVGAPVGCLVGAAVGAAVGAPVDCLVGIGVGAPVGCLVGAAVGAAVVGALHCDMPLSGATCPVSHAMQYEAEVRSATEPFKPKWLTSHFVHHLPAPRRRLDAMGDHDPGAHAAQVGAPTALPEARPGAQSSHTLRSAEDVVEYGHGRHVASWSDRRAISKTP